MLTKTYSEIQDILNKAETGNLPQINVAVLRNVMVEAMVPYLKYLAYETGFQLNMKFGEYDNLVQESIGVHPDLLTKNTRVVLVFAKLENLSWKLARDFAALKPEDLVREVSRIKKMLNGVITGLRKQTNAMILWHGLEMPLYPALGICDSQMAAGQGAVIADLNNFLRTLLGASANAYFIDLNLCLGRLGTKEFYDPRYWHLGRAPYSREALREIAGEDFKFIRPLLGKNRKCLVLDCDNVLWGGIIGEDGMAGIKLSKSYPGSSYYEFQQEILNLYHRGILIAICSKNNPEDVREVMRDHPDMLLREKHVANFQVNWEDKATNLRKIAAALNLGLDSLVFVDDSAFEVNLVKEALPLVSVIHLPQDRSVEYRDILAVCGWFDTLTVSSEDRERTRMYQAEAGRKELQERTQDLGAYLSSLEMVVDVKLADDFAAPRIAQLTQKTNQFNLTTKRYSEADIKTFMATAQTEVLTLHLADKFGDSGLVGVCILKYDGSALIDSFLLSCRVLGRGVEEVFLIQALKRAASHDCREAIGEFRPTAKNAQVKNFFPGQGFQPFNAHPNPEGSRYILHLKNIKPEPVYFKKINGI